MPATATDVFLSPPALLDHWQGHRRLTRRVIEKFPDEQFNTFAIGGMRPFGAMAVEMLQMAAPMVRGALTNEWVHAFDSGTMPKADVLRHWDAATAEMNELWPRIAAPRFQETIKAFGQYEDTTRGLVMYVIDNEIHHRAQGYVYLRALGIEPPHFWERQ
jgi:uncharacterized damage-inducible protein DinB